MNKATRHCVKPMNLLDGSWHSNETVEVVHAIDYDAATARAEQLQTWNDELRTQLREIRAQQKEDYARAEHAEDAAKGCLEALVLCREKLEVYRKHSSGEYLGGVEYTLLLSKMDTALARLLAWRQKVT